MKRIAILSLIAIFVAATSLSAQTPAPKKEKAKTEAKCDKKDAACCKKDPKACEACCKDGKKDACCKDGKDCKKACEQKGKDKSCCAAKKGEAKASCSKTDSLKTKGACCAKKEVKKKK